MKKTTYYLWKSDNQTDKEFESIKQKLFQMGFRVVTFESGQKESAIQNGIKAIIRNHI
ncbi:MAG: hypothetical protein UHS41_01050 [Lachnospiraceae bacterium]|nr:hypothetical protein [Lachnospiraceae bacterium]